MERATGSRPGRGRPWTNGAASPVVSRPALEKHWAERGETISTFTPLSGTIGGVLIELADALLISGILGGLGAGNRDRAWRMPSWRRPRERWALPTAGTSVRANLGHRDRSRRPGGSRHACREWLYLGRWRLALRGSMVGRPLHVLKRWHFDRRISAARPKSGRTSAPQSCLANRAT